MLKISTLYNVIHESTSDESLQLTLSNMDEKLQEASNDFQQYASSADVILSETAFADNSNYEILQESVVGTIFTKFKEFLSKALEFLKKLLHKVTEFIKNLFSKRGGGGGSSSSNSGNGSSSSSSSSSSGKSSGSSNNSKQPPASTTTIIKQPKKPFEEFKQPRVIAKLYTTKAYEKAQVLLDAIVNYNDSIKDEKLDNFECYKQLNVVYDQIPNIYKDFSPETRVYNGAAYKPTIDKLYEIFDKYQEEYIDSDKAGTHEYELLTKALRSSGLDLKLLATPFKYLSTDDINKTIKDQVVLNIDDIISEVQFTIDSSNDINKCTNEIEHCRTVCNDLCGQLEASITDSINMVKSFQEQLKSISSDIEKQYIDKYVKILTDDDIGYKAKGYVPKYVSDGTNDIISRTTKDYKDMYNYDGRSVVPKAINSMVSQMQKIINIRLCIMNSLRSAFLNNISTIIKYNNREMDNIFCFTDSYNRHDKNIKEANDNHTSYYTSKAVILQEYEKFFKRPD